MVEEYFPAGHFAQRLLLDRPLEFEYVPAGQSWHWFADVAPTMLLHFPRPQSVHVPATSRLEYFPCSHEVQPVALEVAPEPVPCMPMPQGVHCANPEEAAYEPEVQGVQPVLLLVPEYEPARHAAQVVLLLAAE